MAVVPAIFGVTTPIPSTLLELEAAARPEGQLAQCRPHDAPLVAVLHHMLAARVVLGEETAEQCAAYAARSTAQWDALTEAFLREGPRAARAGHFKNPACVRCIPACEAARSSLPPQPRDGAAAHFLFPRAHALHCALVGLEGALAAAAGAAAGASDEARARAGVLCDALIGARAPRALLRLARMYIGAVPELSLAAAALLGALLAHRPAACLPELEPALLVSVLNWHLCVSSELYFNAECIVDEHFGRLMLVNLAPLMRALAQWPPFMALLLATPAGRDLATGVASHFAQNAHCVGGSSDSRIDFVERGLPEMQRARVLCPRLLALPPGAFAARPASFAAAVALDVCAAWWQAAPELRLLSMLSTDPRDAHLCLVDILREYGGKAAIAAAALPPGCAYLPEQVALLISGSAEDLACLPSATILCGAGRGAPQGGAAAAAAGAAAPGAAGAAESAGGGTRGRTPRGNMSCAHCGKPGAVNGCSACKTTRYCDKDCQRAHWSLHKGPCKNGDVS